MSDFQKQKFGVTEEQAAQMSYGELKARFGFPVDDCNSPLRIAGIAAKARTNLAELVGEAEAERLWLKVCAESSNGNQNLPLSEKLPAIRIQREIEKAEKVNAQVAELKAKHAHAPAKTIAPVQPTTTNNMKITTETKTTPADKSAAEQLAGMTDPIERARFIQANEKELTGRTAPKRDASKTVFQQFSEITDPLSRGWFYEEHQSELLGKGATN